MPAHPTPAGPADSAGPLTVFLHIPRTGGTTMWSILRRMYAPGRSLRLLEGTSEATYAAFQTVLAEQPRAYDLVGGHFRPFTVQEYAGTRPLRYMTMLRHPAGQALSKYYKVLRKDSHDLHEEFVDEQLSPEAGVARMVPNVQTRYLAGLGMDGDCTPDDLARAKRVLTEQFAVFGLLEHYDASVLLFRRALGWPMPVYVRHNVSRNRPQDGLEEAQARATEHNALDLQLFEYAEQVFQQRVAAAGDDLQRELRMFALHKQLFKWQWQFKEMRRRWRRRD